MSTRNIYPKPCVYNCGIQIYWNTATSEYWEVFTKKKHICPNRVNNNKPITVNTSTETAATTNTSIKPTYYSKKPWNTQPKPNLVCSNCGMWSSRKFSVKRHITNQHSGNAFLVSYIDYLVGRQSGLYPPSAQPEYHFREKKRSSEIFNDEFWKELARKAANGNRNSQF